MYGPAIAAINQPQSIFFSAVRWWWRLYRVRGKLGYRIGRRGRCLRWCRIRIRCDADESRRECWDTYRCQSTALSVPWAPQDKATWIEWRRQRRRRRRRLSQSSRARHLREWLHCQYGHARHRHPQWGPIKASSHSPELIGNGPWDGESWSWILKDTCWISSRALKILTQNG